MTVVFSPPRPEAILWAPRQEATGLSDAPPNSHRHHRLGLLAAVPPGAGGGTAAEQGESDQREEQNGEEAGADQRRPLGRADELEVLSDRDRRDDERQRGRLHQTGGDRVPGVEE